MKGWKIKMNKVMSFKYLNHNNNNNSSRNVIILIIVHFYLWCRIKAKINAAHLQDAAVIMKIIKRVKLLQKKCIKINIYYVIWIWKILRTLRKHIFTKKFWKSFPQKRVIIAIVTIVLIIIVAILNSKIKIFENLAIND